MESAKYIGRVGALAVALGIGAALTTGTGIAFADDSGGSSSSSSDSSSSSGSSSSSDSKGSSTSTKPAKSSDDDSAKTSRKGPLSKLGDRVRKQAEASADRAESALERTQSRLERAQSQLSDRQATLRSKFEDTVSETSKNLTEGATSERRPLANLRPRPSAPESPEAPATVRDNSGRSEAAQVTRATVTPPLPSRPERAAPATLKLRDAGVTETRHGLAAITTPANAVRSIAGRNLTPAPITAFAEAAAPTPTVTLEAPEATTDTGTSMVSALLVAAGLSPLAAGTSPVAPGPSAALWALAAAARRESERVLNPRGAALTSAKDAEAPAVSTDVQPLAAVAAADTQQWQANPGLTDAPVISGQSILRDLGFITGPNTDAEHWYVGGTDLGIMWVGGYENGTPIVYTLFGDTFNEPQMTTGWRNNVLLRSVDTNLRDGLTFRDALIHAGAGPGVPGTPTWYGLTGQRAGAAQIIYDPGYTGWFGSTYTMIPTSAIAVQDDDGNYTQYATVMSVRTWDNPGSWTTNYSAIAVSTDGGKTWTVDPDTVRGSGWLRANKTFEFGNQNFQQNALVQGPDDDPNSWTSADPETREKYIYVYGTPSGRAGSAYLARVPESEFTDLGAYQYWAGENADGTGNWVTGDPSAATSVIGGGNSNYISFLPKDGFLGQLNKMFAGFLNGFIVGGLPTGGNISEMSVQYNEYLDKYVVTYTDSGNNVVMRVSDSPQGTWSNTHTLISNNYTTRTGMYAPMIHPLSGTAAAGEGNEQYLYYNVSFWNAYNVKFMESDLSDLTIT